MLGNTLWYYLLEDWESVFWYFYILPLAATIVGFYMVVEDTPMCLVMRYSSEIALEGFERISKRNKIEFSISLQEI